MAAAAAEDLAAAAKVDKQFGNQLKVLEDLNEAGVDGWAKQLEIIADMSDWPPYLLSLKEEQPVN
jgi:hypothetical protein